MTDECPDNPDNSNNAEEGLASDSTDGFAIPSSVATAYSGDVIDRYKLLQKIGEGGFGVVYMAEQLEPIKRRVALKIIKLGMDTKQVVARFELERQALALMDHPGISKVLDGGATEIGRPYFVMELVRGIPITTYCDKHCLTTVQRLELFTSVCSAIQHAHQKGIIHRDIKPTNILVTLHDGVPVPKVIDFGIAKAIQQDLTDKTLFTRYEQFIGTPAFMSPEQAEMTGLDVDTRSDIYSLGALLYLLVTGQTPLDKTRIENATPDVLRRRIREDTPLKPSDLVRTTQSIKQFLAKNSRAQETRGSSHVFHSDLDWVIMKALEKDRTRRYETAAAFALDIRRYLNKEPVSAIKPSKWYSFWKMAERNRVSFMFGGLVLLIVAAGLLTTSWGLVTATKAKARLENQIETNRIARAKISALLTDTDRQARELAYFAVSRADAAFREKNWSDLQSILDQCPEEWRHWEWRHIDAFKPIHDTVANPGEDSYAHAMSPDGQLMGLGNPWSNQVAVWDLKAKSMLWADEGTVRWTYSEAAFSPDGERVAFALQQGERGGVRIWNSKTGQLIKELSLDSSRASTACFSPDGKLLAVGEDRGIVSFWSTISWKRQFDLAYSNANAGTPMGVSVKFSPDRQTVAMLPRGLDPSNIQIWDLESRSMVQHLKKGHTNGGILNLVYFKRKNWIASSGTDGAVMIWDLSTSKKVAILQHGDKNRENFYRGVRALAISDDEQRIASGCGDGSIAVWDIPSQKQIDRFQSHDGFVQLVQFQAHDSQILYAGVNGPARVWQQNRVSRVFELRGRSEPTAQLAISQRIARPHLAMTSWNEGSIRIYDLESGMGLIRLEQHGRPETIDFLEDTAHLAAFFRHDQTLRIFDVETGNLMREFRPHSKNHFQSAHLSANGRFLAGISADRTIEVWDAKANKLTRLIAEHATNVASLCFSPDEKWLASCSPGDESNEGQTFLWSLTDPKVSIELPGSNASFRSLSFSQDGTQLAAGSDGSVALWSLEHTSAAVRQLVKKITRAKYTSLSFSPDGKRLASGDTRGTLTLWDTKAGIEVASYQPNNHKSPIIKVQFDANGDTIVIAHQSGAIKALESVHPSQSVAETRRYAANATQIVADRYEGLGFTELVLTSLEVDESIDQPTKELAIQLVPFHGEIASKLHADGWSKARQPDRGRAAYQSALKRGQRAVELRPDKYDYLLSVGFAQYRLGHFEDALAAFLQSLDLRKQNNANEDRALVQTYSGMAMSYSHLDQKKTAREMIATALDILGRVGSHEPPPLLNEAKETVQRQSETDKTQPRQ